MTNAVYRLVPKLSVLILLLTLSEGSFSQKIDSLNTEEQVLAFVNKLGYPISINPKKFYALPEYKKVIEDFGSVTFEKADFDNNGQTDLLFTGYYKGVSRNGWLTIVAMAFGDRIVVKDLNIRNFSDFNIGKIVFVDGKPCIHMLQGERQRRGSLATYQMVIRSDTLTYLFDNFIERQARPIDYHIDMIRYCDGGGWTQSSLIMDIQHDSVQLCMSGLMPPSGWTDSGGNFVAKIDSSTMAKIYRLANYLGFPNLKAKYLSYQFDASSSSFTIMYDHGKTKTVAQEDGVGTYGLSAMQDLLFSLVKNLHWDRKDTDDNGCTCDMDLSEELEPIDLFRLFIHFYPFIVR